MGSREDPGVDKYQEDEDNPLSPVQKRQVARITLEFPDVFPDAPGAAKGWEYKIVMPQDQVVMTPIRPVPLAQLGDKAG